jgi:hypothetical protein
MSLDRRIASTFAPPCATVRRLEALCVLRPNVEQRTPGKIMSHAVISSACLLGLFFSAAAPAATAPTTGAKGASAIDACALLHGPEIAPIIGASVSKPLRQDAGLQPDGSYSSTCYWEIGATNPTVPNDPAALGAKKRFVILHAMQWPRGSGLAHTFLDSFREAAANGDIPGKTTPRKVGDEALWWGDGLAVRRYDVSFGLSVVSPGSKSNHTGALEEQLAPYILRRIDKRHSESQH